MSSFITSSVNFLLCFRCCFFYSKFTPSNLSSVWREHIFMILISVAQHCGLIYRKKAVNFHLNEFVLLSFYVYRKYISLDTKNMFAKWNLCTTMALKICFSLKLKRHDEGKCLIKCFFFRLLYGFPITLENKNETYAYKSFSGHYRYFYGQIKIFVFG